MAGIPLEESTPNDNLRSIPLTELVPSPHQPRQYFDTQAVETLAYSMATQGFKSVIVVRPKDGKFEIVAGERRFRAAQLAELQEVLCLVEELSDEEAYQFALDENLNREDLSKLEEVEGILKLIAIKHGIPPEQTIEIVRTEGHPRKQIGGNVHTSYELASIKQVLDAYGIKLETFRSTYLPLLNLPTDLKAAHLNGSLGYNHVLELSKIDDPGLRKQLLNEAIEKKYSVRTLKVLVRKALRIPQSKPKRAGEGPTPEIIKLWNKLKIAPIWHDPEIIEKLYSAMSEAIGIEPEWNADALLE